MKTVKLLTLEIENFKGIQELTLEADGMSLDIFGANATCKTTIVDAYSWLFFDKDSQGRTDFGVKPAREESGIVGLGSPEVSVGAKLEVDYGSGDSRQVYFRKTLKEKWTKKRGQATKVLTGHTYTYQVNEDEVSKTQFLEAVSEVFDLTHIRLLAEPRYLPEVLTWKARRKLILDAFAGESILHQIEENEKERKKLETQKKKINKALAEIPPRIDEVMKGRPSVPDSIDEKELKEEAKRLKNEISKLEIARQSPSAERAQILEKMAELEEKRKTKLRKAEEKRDALIENIRAKRKSIVEEMNVFKTSLREVKEQIGQLQAKKQRTEQSIVSLKTQFEELKSSKPSEDKLPRMCVECPLLTENPENKSKLLRHSLKDWEQQIKFFVADANKEGKRLKAVLAEIEAKITDLEKIKAEHEKNIQALEEKLAKYDFPTETTSMEEAAGLKTIDAEIEKLSRKLNSCDNSRKEELEQQIKELQKELDKIEGILQNLEAFHKAETRIKELKEKERKLAIQYEQIEKKLIEAEKFVRDAATQLEEEVGSHFEITRFRFFIPQFNGGIKDTCDVMSDKGVLYADENNAMKVAIGIDIIKTFQEKWGESYPIFIDNRESVEEIPEVPAQVINLFVSPQHEQLTVYAIKHNEVKDGGEDE